MSQLSMLVRESEPGENLLINTLNISLTEARELRKFIQDGVLIPDEKVLRKQVKEKMIPDFLSGKSLCVYMTYIKQ